MSSVRGLGSHFRVARHQDAVPALRRDRTRADRDRLATTRAVPQYVVNVRHGARCDVYVGRGSPYGNPFTHLTSGTLAKYRVATREEAVAKYEEWLLAPEQAALLEHARRELRGKVLGCWCVPYLCHAEVLARYANA